jgi:hypothetical protein
VDLKLHHYRINAEIPSRRFRTRLALLRRSVDSSWLKGKGLGYSEFSLASGVNECYGDVSTAVSYQRPRLISHGCGMAKVISSRPSMAMFFRKLTISPCFACWS